jgi:hypothetical protein
MRQFYCLCYFRNVTVNPCAISSSGTNSGRNTAGVIHGQFEFVGSRVTITSPLAEIRKKLENEQNRYFYHIIPNPSRIRPVDNSMVRNLLSMGVFVSVSTDAVVDVVIFEDFFGRSITAGCIVLLRF